MEKICIKANLTSVYLYALITFHLLFFGFNRYHRIFEYKVFSFVSISLLYILSIAICRFRQKHEKAEPSRTISATYIFVAFYMLSTTFSALTSPHFPYTVFGATRFEGAFSITIYGICFILVSKFAIPTKRMLSVFSVSLTVFSVLCIFQLLGFNPLSLYPDGMNFYDSGIRYSNAFLGTIGNTNLVGAFICLALPFLCVMVISGKKTKRFFLLIPIVLLTIIVLRMGVLSTVIAILACIIISIPFVFKFNKITTMFYFGAIILLCMCVITILYFYDIGVDFLHELHLILNGRISESFGSGRVRIWKKVVSVISEAPFFGKGPDTMIYEEFAPFRTYYSELGTFKQTRIDVAHNELLNILYHQGIFGLVFYVGFVICIFFKWIKNYKKSPVILALGLSFICYLIQSLFTFSMCITAPYFWCCAALIYNLSN